MLPKHLLQVANICRLHPRQVPQSKPQNICQSINMPKKPLSGQFQPVQRSHNWVPYIMARIWLRFRKVNLPINQSSCMDVSSETSDLRIFLAEPFYIFHFCNNYRPALQGGIWGQNSAVALVSRPSSSSCLGKRTVIKEL